MPTFREDLHLGHEVPMIDSDDIRDRAILARHIADRVINWWHIALKAIRNEHIDDGAVDARTIADNAVLTRHIHDKAVTPDKLSDEVVPEVIEPLLKPLRDKDKDLQNQIESLNKDEYGRDGIAVSNHFGDNPHIGVSQLTLTNAFNNVWNKLEEITGEVLRGISMVISPTYYIGEDGCTVHITASSVEALSIFEEIWFYWNDNTEPFAGKAEPDNHFEFDTEVSETTYIKCRAKIMGIWYEDYKVITHHPSIWIGAGNDYQSVMIDTNLTQLRQHMRGVVDIIVGTGNRIYIIMAESFADGFIRADMNGVEIAFTQSTVTIDGKNYKVFASEDTYQAGTYNIDING